MASVPRSTIPSVVMYRESTLPLCLGAIDIGSKDHRVERAQEPGAEPMHAVHDDGGRGLSRTAPLSDRLDHVPIHPSSSRRPAGRSPIVPRRRRGVHREHARSLEGPPLVPARPAGDPRLRRLAPRPHLRADRPRPARMGPLAGRRGRGRAARLRRGGLRLHGASHAPRRRPVSRPERAQAPRRILALHPGRRARRGHGDDDPGRADPPGARHHRPHLVARAPAPRTRGRVPGGPDLRGRQHRPVSLRQRRATSSMRSTCFRWRHWP